MTSGSTRASASRLTERSRSAPSPPSTPLAPTYARTGNSAISIDATPGGGAAGTTTMSAPSASAAKTSLVDRLTTLTSGANAPRAGPAARNGAMTSLSVVLGAAIVNDVSLPDARNAAVRLSVASRSSRPRASTSSSAPAAVSRTPPSERTSNSTPSSRSSARNCRETAGWLTCDAADPAVTDPASATATK